MRTAVHVTTKTNTIVLFQIATHWTRKNSFIQMKIELIQILKSKGKRKVE